MENRYAPLVLPAPLGAMPQDYQNKIVQFDGIGPYTTQHHVNKMTDYFKLREIDIRDFQMRHFAQTLVSDVRKWFRALPANSIQSLDIFYQQFLNRWENKKNPLQILSEYENIKIGPNETIQDYCTKFNNIYNAILVNLKPPPDLALIKFPNGFDTDMEFQLRERNPQLQKTCQSVAVSVEANLLAKRARVRNERRGSRKDEASPSYLKIDVLPKSMEKIMNMIDNMERKPEWDNQQEPLGRNPNFRKNKNQNTAKNGPDQNIRPPFQENYAGTSHSDDPEQDTRLT